MPVCLRELLGLIVFMKPYPTLPVILSILFMQHKVFGIQKIMVNASPGQQSYKPSLL